MYLEGWKKAMQELLKQKDFLEKELAHVINVTEEEKAQFNKLKEEVNELRDLALRLGQTHLVKACDKLCKECK
jgi:hypothetical protein